jgi:hypothetical protein
VYRDPADFYLGYINLADLDLLYRDPAEFYLGYRDLSNLTWCTGILLTLIRSILLNLSGLQGPTDLYLM